MLKKIFLVEVHGSSTGLLQRCMALTVHLALQGHHPQPGRQSQLLHPSAWSHQANCSEETEYRSWTSWEGHPCLDYFWSSRTYVRTKQDSQVTRLKTKNTIWSNQPANQAALHLVFLGYKLQKYFLSLYLSIILSLYSVHLIDHSIMTPSKHKKYWTSCRHTEETLAFRLNTTKPMLLLHINEKLPSCFSSQSQIPIWIFLFCRPQFFLTHNSIYPLPLFQRSTQSKSRLTEIKWVKDEDEMI